MAHFPRIGASRWALDGSLSIPFKTGIDLARVLNQLKRKKILGPSRNPQALRNGADIESKHRKFCL
jgi:hypothetical protein